MPTSEGPAGRDRSTSGWERFRHHRHWIEPLLGLVLFGIAMAALRHQLRDLGLREITRTLNALPATSVAAAVGLTLAGYAALTLYDYLAVRYAGARLPYLTVAPAAFVGSALSHNLGMAALTGGPIRFRFYSAAGLGPTEIARIVVFVGATFWLGVAALSGAAFLAEPLPIPRSLQWGFADTRVPGFALLLLTAAYLAVVALYRKPLRIRTFELKLPSLRIALLQLLVASADLTAAAGVIYVLLPGDASVGFPRFMAIYLLALIVGVISQVPGGLGVFEAVLIATLPVELPGSTVLATLLAYRAIYYVLPLFLAGGVLAAFEARRHRQRLAPVWRSARVWVPVLIPHAAAAVTFLAGAVLLLSGSIPALPHRVRELGSIVPLPVIELSHLLASLIGVALLFVARGLQRRLDSAYVVSIALLVAGAVASLVKGFDFEEAAILTVVGLVLLPMRDLFYRKSSLLTERFSGGWFTAIAVALGASIWLGLLAYRHVEYSGDLWWQFALHGDASRSLRAALAIAVVALGAGLAKLLGPAGPQPQASVGTVLHKASVIVAQSRDSAANLALLGDKTFLFSPDGKGFVMYGVEGRSWISLGDPIGTAESQRELVWSFRGLVDRYDGWPVFYGVQAKNIPLYLDLGLTLIQLGEEALVPLGPFSLEGDARRSLRGSRRSAENHGCRFTVAGAHETRALLPELRRISDEWLASKRTREKRFSLGCFEEGYLQRFPQALVRCHGAIVAFANVWSAADRDELSVDLMRYSAQAPPGTLDYLFVELMLWGKAQGYRRFNLGLAPMSGPQDHALAPLWNRVGFEGLRAYKAKFDPEWQPRYLASPAGFALPRILDDLATLISGGVRGVQGGR